MSAHEIIGNDEFKPGERHWTGAPQTQAELRAEVERLRRWKAEASEVILGLQDVGKALGLRPGEQITGASGVRAAERLTSRAEAAEAQVARIKAEMDAWGDWPLAPIEGEQSADMLRSFRAVLDGDQ